MITQELLKDWFDYKDGILHWKISPNWAIKVGKIAGHLNHFKDGDRWSITFQGKTYLRSRLVFLYHKGFLPEFVDHKNHIRLDDKIENLRAASRAENNKNVTSHKNTTSKYLGVCAIKTSWRATIMINRKQKYLGRFKNENDAALAYNKAAEFYHGEFANLNKIDN